VVAGIDVAVESIHRQSTLGCAVRIPDGDGQRIRDDDILVRTTRYFAEILLATPELGAAAVGAEMIGGPQRPQNTATLKHCRVQGCSER
jgi:hypothetical protein